MSVRILRMTRPCYLIAGFGKGMVEVCSDSIILVKLKCRFAAEASKQQHILVTWTGLQREITVVHTDSITLVKRQIPTHCRGT